MTDGPCVGAPPGRKICSEAPSGFGVGPGRRPKGRRPFATSELRRIFGSVREEIHLAGLCGAAGVLAALLFGGRLFQGGGLGEGIGGDLALLELAEEALGAIEDLLGQAGEAGDLDAVALVGGALDDLDRKSVV